MEFAPGTILLGKYRIDQLIGTGGMGNVVRASHLFLQQAVAIKILLPQMVENESTVQRFLREAQAAVKLKSEHSARVMDVGTTPDGAPFMVMELLEGNDLNQILRHHGPQLPPIVVDMMLQACEGISEAHALGIIHRDIKPSNFFITRRPDGSMLLKILDFGISKTPVGYDELTGTQMVMGTPSYMAPEQMKSGRAADPRSDVWSMGVVMYQLLTGQTPFSGESYADLVLKVGLEPPTPIRVPLPNGLAEVVLRCLEKDPRARFQNVGELARMLAPYASDPTLAAQSATRSVRTLEQRGAQAAMQGSPFVPGGGVTPPISPAQMTPHSWSPHTANRSYGSSLSHGAGQVSAPPRKGRGLLIAGIASLCVIAGVGGYAISQASRTEPAPIVPSNSDPRIVAPPPSSAAATPTTPSTATAPSTTTTPTPTPTTTAPTPPTATTPTPPPTPTTTTPPTPTTTTPPTPTTTTAPTPTTTTAPTPPTATATNPAGHGGEAGSDAPRLWKPPPATPTLPDSKPGAHAAADPKPAAPAPGERPANPTLVDAKPSVAPHPATSPETKPAKPAASTETKPAPTKPAEIKPAKPAETKPTKPAKPAETKPARTKPAKPKSDDDLFDSRH